MRSEGLLYRFLGIERWRELYSAVRQESSTRKLPEVNFLVTGLICFVVLFPFLLAHLSHGIESQGGWIVTLAIGISTLLALIARSRLDLRMKWSKDIRSNINLTHTAVALGCIPAIIIIACYPDLLAQRSDTLRSVGLQAPREQLSLLRKFAIILGIAAWAATTEEILFRGCLFSFLRRCRLFSRQQTADFVSACICAVGFGLSHWSTWGPVAAIALIGLGLGFTLAYLANGEKLLPLILYHFAFDILSLFVASML